MEQLESLQRVNRQQRLAEWSRRVETCRSSGLTVVQWCQENGIAVSTYFSWQRKVFQALKEVQEVTFMSLLQRLERAEAEATGVTAKGFQAIRMLMDGYTNREIGEMFGVPANHVTAWVARARKMLSELD